MNRAANRHFSPATETGVMRLQSKPMQLADYLRQSILQSTLVEPLPGMREWSRQLGVSRRTLHAAVQILQGEQLIAMHQRGARLHPHPPDRHAVMPAATRRVRWLNHGTFRHLLHSHRHTFDRLHECLRLRGIELKSEICTPVRLREIARLKPVPNELLLLGSLPANYQRLFAATARPMLVLGEVAPGLELPFVNCDQVGAVRHATHRLLRQGCTQLRLVHLKSTAPGMRSALASFRHACAHWAQGAVPGQTIATEVDLTALLDAMKRVTAHIKQRTGIIVLSPVPIAMVITALLQHGIAVPGRAEVVALLHSPEAVRLYPPPPVYPWPMSAIVREITRAAERFFATGQLAAGGKHLTAELAKPE
jgi:hypothetical protein